MMREMEEPQERRAKGTGMTRREFLRTAGLAAAGAAAGMVAGACGAPLPKIEYKPVVAPRPIAVKKESARPRAIETTSELAGVRFDLGEEKAVATGGLQWVPDARSSFISLPDGGIRVFVAAGTEGYMMDGSSLDSLGEPVKILEPDRTRSDLGFNGYRAPGAVLTGGGPEELVCFYHEEYWPNEETHFPFTARVGVTRSEDGGKSWGAKTAVVEGQNMVPAKGERVSGAGQPSAIWVEEGGRIWAYVYHIDWDGPHAIHVARAPLPDVEKPERWEKFYQEKFVAAGEKKSTAVISPPEGEGYAALPCVSFNKDLGEFLAVFETQRGFRAAVSRDGVNWGGYSQVWNFDKPQWPKERGSKWYSYPTMWTPETGNQMFTGKEGVLVYSRGVYDVPHTMAYRPFRLESN